MIEYNKIYMIEFITRDIELSSIPSNIHKKDAIIASIIDDHIKLLVFLVLIICKTIGMKLDKLINDAINP
jgi:hypothetical protein